MFARTALSGLLGLVAYAGSAAAQSFDCEPYLDQRQAPETVICETPQLQALDEEMAALYFDLMNRLNPSQAAILRDSQRRWLAARNACGFNANCLVGRYRQRVDLLGRY